MINCIKCNSPLILKLDLKDLKVNCSNCSKEYKFDLNKQNIHLESDGKHLDLFIKDSYKVDSGFSKKIIYDLYNKGYISCVKILNKEFNDNKSLFNFDLNKVINKISNDYKDRIIEINKKIEYIKNLQNAYFCVKCNNIVSFEKAIVNNFLCNICSNNLDVYNKDKDIKELLRIKNDLISESEKLIVWS